MSRATSLQVLSVLHRCRRFSLVRLFGLLSCIGTAIILLAQYALAVDFKKTDPGTPPQHPPTESMAPPAAAASGAAPADSGGSAEPPSAAATAARTAALCEPEPETARRGQGSLDVYCIRHGTALHNVAFDTHRSRDVFFSDQCRDSPLMRKGHQEAQARGRSWKASSADPEYAKFAPASAITVDVKSTITLVYVSPLTRTLMTLSNIWKDEIVSVFGEGRNEAGKFPAAWGAEDCDLAGNIWDWAKGLTVVHSVPKEELLAGYRKKRDLLSERHNVRFVALEELREYAMGMAANSRQDRSLLELWFPWVDFSLIPETDEIFDRTVDVEANRKKNEEFARSSSTGGVVVEGPGELIEYELGREKPTQYKELVQKHGFTWKTPNQKNKLSTGSGSGTTTSFLIEDVPHVAHRIRDLKRFLLQTHVANVAGGNSTNTSRGGRIALVSHSGFLGQMMFNAFWRNGERMTQLEHCYPYEYQVRAEDLDTLWGPDVEDEDRKVKIINPFVDANANREN